MARQYVNLERALLAIVVGLSLVAGFADVGAGAPLRTLSDEQIVAQGRLVASGPSVEIYQHGVAVDPSFLKVVESAYEQVETITGLQLDKATEP